MHFLHGSIERTAIVQMQHLPHLEVNETKYTQTNQGIIHMAYATHIHTGILNAPRARLAAMFDTMRSGLARRKIYNKTLAELQALGDRDLADLGLDRSMLHSIAYGAAYEV